MANQRGNKVLFIGLDSAEPELLLRWANDGTLPVLHGLLQRSAWCEATAPRGFGNGVVWPSLYTGVGPATHGRYFYQQLRLGSYDVVEFKEDEGLCRAPFWKALSDAGKRVGVIDMVRAPLVTGLNGFQIADWLTHDATGPARSTPPELAEQVVARLGSDPVGGNADRFIAEGATPGQLRDALKQRIDAKTRLTREFLEQGKHDILITVYGEPHDVGHLCWHVHDPKHVRFKPELAQRYGDPVRDVLIHLDAAIGQLLQSIDDNTTVVLFSGPGMGPAYTGNYLLDAILLRLDGLDQARAPTVLDKFKNLYKKYAPAKWRRRIYKQRGGLRSASDTEARATRRFFQLPHNQNAGAVRINLEGREPNGRVRADQYDAVCDELSAALREIVNVDTGESIVAEVVKIRDVCSGPQRDDLPDLLIVWNRPVPIVTIESPRIGRMMKEYGGVRTGDHTPHCVFMMSGPRMAAGRVETAMSVEAIAPTVAQLLDVELAASDAPSQLSRFQAAAR